MEIEMTSETPIAVSLRVISSINEMVYLNSVLYYCVL